MFIHTDNQPGKRLIFSTFAAVYGVGYLSYMLMPLQVGALIKFLELNEAETGIIVTAELISLAIALIILAPKINAIDKRKLALFGGLLVIVGHATAAMVGSYTLLIPCRIAVGLGAGMMIAAGNAIIASYKNPQRLFAIIFTIGQMQAACFLFILPNIIALWAHTGIYSFMAIWTIFMLLLILYLPRDLDISPSSKTTIIKTNYSVYLLPSVLAMILIGASDASLWTFQERIADSLGLNKETIGLVLGGALIAGMSGAALAAVIGDRIGHVFPIVSGLVWMAICYLIITHTKSQTIYIFTTLSYLFAYGFVIPYLFGLNGELDPKGGAMVAANGCNLIGISLGPICTGYIIVHSGYSTVGFTISLFAIAAMLVYLMVLKKVRRQSPQASI